MTCPACGGLVVRDRDLPDSSPGKCLNCGRSPNDPPRRDENGEIGKVRNRLHAVLGGLGGRKATDYPLEEERIGDFGNDEEAPPYQKERRQNPKNREVPVSRKTTPTDLAAIRRERLKILTDRFGGPYRTAKKFPELSPATMGNVLRGKFSMGDPQARKIERAAGLPEGWMDGDGPADLPASVNPPVTPPSPGQTERPPDRSRREDPKKLYVCKIGDPPAVPPVPGLSEAGGEISGSGKADEILEALAKNPRVLRIDVISVVLAEAR
ncbi:MAG: hypothetical protein M1537_01695 [Nitrospirae bacterium]|nr:hypothetical protein [Nitrospirota bacterium]MCL5284182.1 hypothetical protein [Nitrospirota bacterium]